MRAYRLTHLGNTVVVDHFRKLAFGERERISELLAYMGEMEARKLYLPAGYSSMYDYCLGEFGWSRPTTLKRIGAARAARKYPEIFVAIADGRLHVSGVVLLRRHLTPENAGELLAAAAHRTKFEIERLIAERFPKPDAATRIEAVTSVAAPASVGLLDGFDSPGNQDRDTPVPSQAPANVPVRHQRVTPLAPERFALQVTIDQDTYEKLQYAQELLSHQIPAGDVASVLGRALTTLIAQLEKRKYAATDRPRAARGPSRSERHIPAHVRRAVRERDRGQCTFVGETGHRCGTRRFLEYDHVEPVARGGATTVENVRLRCRAHNQYEAERVFGAGFMDEKRNQARRAAADARTRAAEADARTRTAEAEAAAAEARVRAAAQEHIPDVISCLRELGFRADQSRRAAEFSASLPDITIEERVRAALRYLCPKTRSPGRMVAA